MDDISVLIREAKPLYLARKRRRQVIKSALAMAAVMWIGLASLWPVQRQAYPYYWDSEFSLSGDETSVVEDLGLPTDEYGFLMVS